MSVRAPGGGAGSSSPAGPAYSTVALGDSVPAGTACDCVPYPELAASSLTVAGSREVTAANDAIGGSTTEGVLAQLSSRPDVSSRVAQADVVEHVVSGVVSGRRVGDGDVIAVATGNVGIAVIDLR